MFKNYKYLLPILCITLLIACKSDKSSSNVNAVPEAVVDSKPNNLPPLGDEIFKKMYDECTFIDYLWHDLPFSVSQAEKAAVQANVSFISKSGLDVIPNNCKSIGRKSYQINGDIYLDADVYFTPGCRFYIFLKNEKPLYLNKMTAQGEDFYARLFTNAMKQGQKIIDSQGN